MSTLTERWLLSAEGSAAVATVAAAAAAHDAAVAAAFDNAAFDVTYNAADAAIARYRAKRDAWMELHKEDES